MILSNVLFALLSVVFVLFVFLFTVSGWYCNANFRYASLMTFASDDGEMPKIINGSSLSCIFYSFFVFFVFFFSADDDIFWYNQMMI